MTSTPYVQDVASIRRALRLVRRGTTPHSVAPSHLEANGFSAEDAADTTTFLEQIGLLSPEGTPTDTWIAYRDSDEPHAVLAEMVRHAYPELSARVETDVEVDDATLVETVGSDDPETAHKIVATFRQLGELVAQAVRVPSPSEPTRPRREVLQDVSTLLQLSVHEFEVARQCLHHDLLRPAVVSAWNSFAALAVSHLAGDDFAALRSGPSDAAGLTELMRRTSGADLVAILADHALVSEQDSAQLLVLLQQRDDAARPLPVDPDRGATADYLNAILTVSASLTTTGGEDAG
jgi:hypothetical protein